MEKIGYVAIRKNKDGEFFRISEIQFCGDGAKTKSILYNIDTGPGWAKANPVQRIVKVKISVLGEV